MNPIGFSFGVHNHQPAGNFDHVIEDAYQMAYLPYLEALKRHPGFRTALHCSGLLWEWLEQRHPEYLDLIGELVEGRRLELLTGGFYEPILPVIPDADKVGQILKLTEYLERRFGVRPRGLWLAERVWEPHLPRALREAGVDYIMLDDSHFKCAGLRDEQTYGYYLTEELGRSVAAFPISKMLRYAIPYGEVEEIVANLRQLAEEEEGPLTVFADDGEKFGVWPESNRHCYQDGWLERFMSAIEANQDWIEMRTFSEALDERQPLGPVYLPTASYSEMMEWAMPPDAIRHYAHFNDALKQHDLYQDNQVFVRGGFWRNFLAKYQEADHLHKRMLLVSDKLAAVAKPLAIADRSRDQKYLEAREQLWRAQCNCAYWHGVFGGLYLPHLRHALYQSLIRAEAIVESLRHRREHWLEIDQLDFNADGAEEVIVKSPVQQLFFAPAAGGALIEHDYLPAAVNLTDSLRRRDEAYHDKLQLAQVANSNSGGAASIHDHTPSKEAGLEKLLRCDWHRRASLLDHFLAPDAALDALVAGVSVERGDFVNTPYECKIRRVEAERAKVTLSRTGSISGQELQLAKTITIDDHSGQLEFEYLLENRSPQKIEALLAVEFNLNLLAGNAPDRYYFIADQPLKPNHLASVGEIEQVQVFGMKDHWQNIMAIWRFEQPVCFWRYPVETVSLSEAGFERLYQSSCVLPNLAVKLAPGETMSFSFTLEIAPAEEA